MTWRLLLLIAAFSLLILLGWDDLRAWWGM